MSKAYLNPDTPLANIAPGQQDVRMVPINRMLPRSFFTNIQVGALLKVGQPATITAADACGMGRRDQQDAKRLWRTAAGRTSRYPGQIPVRRQWSRIHESTCQRGREILLIDEVCC